MLYESIALPTELFQRNWSCGEDLNPVPHPYKGRLHHQSFRSGMNPSPVCGEGGSVGADDVK